VAAVAIWYIFSVRASRHVRALALLLALVGAFAVGPILDGRTSAPLGVDEAVGAPQAPARTTRSVARVRLADDGRLDPTERRVAGPASPAALTGYVRPLPRGRLTLPFGPSRWGSRVVDGELFHDGVDFATFCGDRIIAAHDGTVLAAGRRFDAFMGWQGDLEPYTARLDEKGLWGSLPIMVVIDDGNGYRSMYAHFSKVVVERGQVVRAGDLLGYEGRTGRASGCHLHYGLFSPLETDVFALEPAVAARLKLPAFQTARIDPLLVLPPEPTPTPAPTLSPWGP
jgi:murein DD-endopeptidase MepM/ murein hydrolase activator NlpD